MAIKVFIVDDHYMLIEGIHSLLQNEKSIQWLGHATTAANCIAFLQKQSPDVLLMDINLPDKSGIELCAEVRQKYPGVNIIAVSTINQQSFIEKMLQNGALGYVLKNATQQELVEAITAVAKGKTYLSHEASLTLRTPSNSGVVLTRREKEVLELIAEGMTNNQIAQKLFISITTVDTHRKNLLAKLEVKNTASLIGRAAKKGLI